MTKNNLDTYLEIGNKKVFACAIQWPGWCRSGRDEQVAIQTLLAYTPRYARIVNLAGIAFIEPKTVGDFKVVERIEGNFATSYGVPDLPIPGDSIPLTDDQVDRFTKILKACWLAFANIAQSTQGKELRKGPRGGGRELEEIISHVAHAEKGYLRHLGWNGEIQDEKDINVWMTQVRGEILNAIPMAVRGQFPILGPHGGKRWPLAYFFRRIAWHVIDHAWEIEDRIV